MLRNEVIAAIVSAQPIKAIRQSRRTVRWQATIGCTLGLISLLGTAAPLSAGPIPDLQLSYLAPVIESSVDKLGAGSLQSGSSLDPGSNSITEVKSGAVVIGITRPVNFVGFATSGGVFATPVHFGPDSVFAVSATFIAPSGPHAVGNQWAVTVGGRTGGNEDLTPEKRVLATFRVRGTGAGLNVFGSAVPLNLPNIPQNLYDAIFDPVDPVPFTLELYFDRTTGTGVANLKVEDSVFSTEFRSAMFPAGSTDTITAIGPSVAVVNGAGGTATVAVRDFRIFTPKQRPSNGKGDLCPAEFGCRLWPQE